MEQKMARLASMKIQPKKPMPAATVALPSSSSSTFKPKPKPQQISIDPVPGYVSYRSTKDPTLASYRRIPSEMNKFHKAIYLAACVSTLYSKNSLTPKDQLACYAISCELMLVHLRSLPQVIIPPGVQPPQAYLTDQFPTAEERHKLYNLEQNSDLWVFMRRMYIGASEYATMLGMSEYQMVYHYIMFKLGMFGFVQEPKLEFAAGHHFEDHAADGLTYVAQNLWGLENFNLGKVGVVVDDGPHGQPAIWASIDTLCQGEGVIPLQLLRNWDPDWHCGWTFTEKEIAQDGIDIEDCIGELKNHISPKMLAYIEDYYDFYSTDPTKHHLYLADEAYIIQVMQQLRIWRNQSNQQSRSYAFIAKLQIPFKDRITDPTQLGITIEAKTPWRMHIWLYKFEPTFFDKAIPRETYFMEQYRDMKYEGFAYPPHLPPPDIPVGIFLGSHDVHSIPEDLVVKF